MAQAPSYALKLNEWHDKEIQKQAISADQQILQNEIATEMGLTTNEHRSVVYLSVAYEVVATLRMDDAGQEFVSCTIKSNPVEEVIG